MARVMFVQPWKYQDEGIGQQDLGQQWRNGPYGVLVLASQLRKHGHEVSVQDLQSALVRLGGDTQACLDRFGQAVMEFRPDILGFSFFTVHYAEIKKALAFARQVCKREGLSPAFVGGGIHVSAEPLSSLEDLGFDYVFVGEAEEGILDLADGVPPTHVPGVVPPSSSCLTRGNAVQDLDTLPFPDWGLCDYQFYATPSYGKVGFRAVRALDMMVGRGCAYKCSFCAYTALSKLRFHSAEYLVDQVEYMLGRFGVDSVYFTDSTIGNNRRLLREFCELMIRRGFASRVEWFANIRPNQVNEDQLRLMWRAGCRFLLYGFESGSQRVLDLMVKGCRVESNYEAAELHNRLGFPYHASILLGFPGEREEDIRATLEFLRRVRPPKVGINWYVPLPGSPDYDKLKEAGRIDVVDATDWRRFGEVNEARVYADVEASRFRDLYAYAQRLASRSAPRWAWFAEHAKPGELEPPTSTLSTRTARGTGDHLQISGSRFDQSAVGPALREKWKELPATREDRFMSREMLEWPADRLLQYWEECRETTSVWDVRGWYQSLYASSFEGADLADIGPGVGIDGIFFAQHGARVTFVDIVEDNLKVVQRICALKGVKADFYFIDDFFRYRFGRKFDVLMFIGSFHNAPFAFSEHQARALVPWLKGGGKVVMLAYPKERYVASGARTFEEFGKMTDGERTPWCEWYDDEKIRALFGPDFFLNWSRNFGKGEIEFNWFDLTRIQCTQQILPA